ncbi:MAG: hypothetical protein AB7T31_15450 [Gemmatimonadales bacterium]
MSALHRAVLAAAAVAALTLVTSASAQTASAVGPSDVSGQAPPRRTVGFELDALPFASGGYYGSLWLGADHLRLRGVVTRMTLPDFLVDDSFDESEMDVYALIVDYMPRPGFSGPWLGAGIEYWDRSIASVTDGATAEWDNLVTTVGAGWVRKLLGDLYVNPWAAVHLVVGGDSEVRVGSSVYDVPRFVTEASLKLGWHF